MRVVVVAGIATGIVVVGGGSRLAMFALRATSHDRVNGRISDDGFEIGRFTLGGTYNLVALGAAVGVIGAVAYLFVRPFLIGPRWFRYVTVALASGAVVGSMMLHADGIDFRALTPTWFAMALFIALPFLFGLAISWAVDLLDRTPMPTGVRRYAAPVALVAIVPFTAVIVPFAGIAVFMLVAVRDIVRERGRPLGAGAQWAFRVAWLSIAVLGLVALINDVQAIRDVT